MTPADNPFLSLVVAARNDDHGVGFLRRMQAFLNGFIEQCRVHQVPAEIIVVEWNPPADRPPLVEALQWPIAMDWCRVRFIEVPPEIHRRYAHSSKQALYQMIAKNVAIRRAKAEFILATNVDIFFNDELMQFFARRALERGKMYRMDRYDAGADFPEGKPVGEQLEYCRSHVLRISAREATFPINEMGHRTWPGEDIADSTKLGLETGWHVPELSLGKLFRNVDDGAVIVIPAGSEPTDLVLWLDPGVAAIRPVRVRVERVEAGCSTVAVAEVLIDEMQRVVLPVPASNVPLRFVFHVEGARRFFPDVRMLLLRAWSVELGSAAADEAPDVRPQMLTMTDKIALAMREKTPRMHAVLAPSYRRFMGMREEPVVVMEEPAAKPETPVPAPVQLHTNACGDFTLLHRDHWEDLRGYPEFDAYSMNIDSALCWAAHHAGFREEILHEPMRIYHMEHGAGWTPESSELLYNRIREAGLPWLEYSQLLGWEHDMRQWKLPMIFNKADWGLGGETLKETVARSG